MGGVGGKGILRQKGSSKDPNLGRGTLIDGGDIEMGKRYWEGKVDRTGSKLHLSSPASRVKQFVTTLAADGGWHQTRLQAARVLIVMDHSGLRSFTTLKGSGMYRITRA